MRAAPSEVAIQVSFPVCGGAAAIAGEWEGAHPWEEGGSVAGKRREGWEKMSGTLWALSLADISQAPTLEPCSDVPKIDRWLWTNPRLHRCIFSCSSFITAPTFSVNQPG